MNEPDVTLSSSPWTWQRRDAVFLLGLLALVVVLVLLMGVQLVDDAYISLRYARNLGHGAGFVYNSGERVLGSTAPLYVLLMALPARWLPDVSLVDLARWIGLLADACTIVMLYLGLVRSTRMRVLAAAGTILYALSPLRLLIGLSGMETSLTMATIVAVWLANRGRRYALALCLAGLGTLLRPEVGLLVVLLLVDAAWQRPRRLPHLMGCVGLAVGPWLLFAVAYFGALVPHSVTAKMAMYVQHSVERTLSDLVFLLNGFLHWSQASLSRSLALALLLSLTVGLFALGLYRAIRRRDPAWPVLAFAPVFLLFYLIGQPYIFYWYVGPLLPAVTIGLVLGSASLIAHGPRPDLIHRLALLAIVLAVADGYSLEDGRVRPRQLVWGIATTAEREALYIQVSRRLAPMVDSQTVVAAPEIGALGYYLPARILDTAGLVSPEALRYLDPKLSAASRLGHAISPKLIEAYLPDYIVTLDVFAEALSASPVIARNYDLIHTYASGTFGSQQLLVYRERNAQSTSP
ncbi:MAG TPA: hypothetical protein VJG32_20165 [Anaerolineae bacterium]|nr:hypothetical protein [Anaerolineae bacterium]